MNIDEKRVYDNFEIDNFNANNVNDAFIFKKQFFEQNNKRKLIC